MGRMVRDVLAVPASGCAVERQFSVSGKMTVWQRNRLSPKIISDAMIYNAALAHTRCPLHVELDGVDEIDQLPVREKEGTIPEEWMSGWWLTKLEKGLPSQPIIDMFYGEDEEEDLYG
jgi:hypothetical protein